MARTPSASGRRTRCRASGSGGQFVDGPLLGRAANRASAIHRFAEAAHHATEQSFADWNRQRSTRWTRHRVGTDARDFTERHEHHLVAAKTNHLGLQAGRRPPSGIAGHGLDIDVDQLSHPHTGYRGAHDQPSHFVHPARDAQWVHAVEGVERLGNLDQPWLAVAFRHHVRLGLGPNAAQRSLQGIELGLQTSIEPPDRRLDHAAMPTHRSVGDDLQIRGGGNLRRPVRSHPLQRRAVVGVQAQHDPPALCSARRQGLCRDFAHDRGFQFHRASHDLLGHFARQHQGHVLGRRPFGFGGRARRDQQFGHLGEGSLATGRHVFRSMGRNRRGLVIGKHRFRMKRESRLLSRFDP